MNSVHDIGGTDGFGPVREEANEPVFHAPWEKQVFGMFLSGVTAIPIDAARHQLERLDPLTYIGSSYYERWLRMLQNVLVQNGTLSAEEIEARVHEYGQNPDSPAPRRQDPHLAAQIPTILRAGSPATRLLKAKPRFALGDRVITRNLHPHGHTRMPRYTRNKHGVITAHHGAHVFPDTNAHGLGENPQHLYTVRISARELWGDSAEPNECVLIDLWESYLAPDGAAAKPSPARRTVSAKAAKPEKAKAVKVKRMTAKVATRTAKPARGRAKPVRKKTR